MADAPKATLADAQRVEGVRPRDRPRQKKWSATWRRAFFVAILACLFLTLAALRAPIKVALSDWTSKQAPMPVTAIAQSTTIPHDVLAGGELQSADAVDVVSDVEGTQIKIVEMVPEGTSVAKDELVLRLDPSEIKNRLAEQRIKVTQADAAAKAAKEELQIQRNVAESALAEAQLTVKLAELDRKKYMEGEYQVEFNDLQGSIALAGVSLTVKHDCY